MSHLPVRFPQASALVLWITLFLVAACGVPLADGSGDGAGDPSDPRPTPTPPLPTADLSDPSRFEYAEGRDEPSGGNAECMQTLIGYSGPHEVVPGVDPVPSGPDMVNRGGCRFDQPVTSVTVVLRNPTTERIWTHEFSEPVTEIGLPLADDVLGTLPAELALGAYQREIRVTYEDGETETLRGTTETVHVVAERGLAVVPIPATRPTATPRPPGLVVAVSGELAEAIRPSVEAFGEEHGVQVIVAHGAGEALTNRLVAEHAAGRYTTDIAVLDDKWTERLVEAGIAESWSALEMGEFEGWNVVVLGHAPNPAETALFVEWMGRSLD